LKPNITDSENDPAPQWKALRRLYGPTGWWPRDRETTLFDPASVTVTRYRYRGDIPSRWDALAQLA